MSDRIFNLLDDWRNLPNYQLERRSDIFFAIHLPMIIEKILATKIDLIIPEFPIRKDTKNNLSFKVDYLVYSEKEKKVFLIELKTNQESRNSEQDSNLEKASKLTVKDLVFGLENIYSTTKSKVKYEYLFDKIESIGWIKRNNKEIINSNINIKPEIIYIQPIDDKPTKKNNSKVISFDGIINALSDSDDPLTIRFIESLEKWKSNPNKKK